MASTGIHRKIDDLGRIVIPVGIRRNLGIGEGDHLEVSVESNRIILAKASDQCAVCGTGEDLVEARDRQLCQGCIDDFMRARAGGAQVLVLDEPEAEPSIGASSRNAW